MLKSPDEITLKLIEFPEKDPGQIMKLLVQQLDVNKAFLAVYIKDLELEN
jgi:hypothetical protein